MELTYLRAYESKCGGWVDLHPLHGADELPDNMEASRILADYCYQIELLPYLPGERTTLRQNLLPDVFEHKNPDIRINGHLIGDIKTPCPNTIINKQKISHMVGSAAKQKVDVAILNLFERIYAVQDIKKGIVGALQPERNKSIRHVWIITKDKNLFNVEREMVYNDSIYEVLYHL